jgi:pimeloyl-ACP methyl ester carboxylesterase
LQQTPILLVPGLNCTAEIFAPQTLALWPRGPVTIANTLVGETIAEIAENILATAPPRFALGGISMGGYLCFEIFRQAPDRVLKLALIDTSARPDSAAQTAVRVARIAEAEAGNFETVIAGQFPIAVDPSRVEDPVLRAMHMGMARVIGIEGYVRQQRATIGRADSRSTLPAIKVPTVVIVGENDQLTPPELSREMAQRIAGAQLAIIAQSGHMSTMEQPEQVNAALLRWLG